MKRVISTTLLFIISAFNGFADSYSEVGFHIGPSVALYKGLDGVNCGAVVGADYTKRYSTGIGYRVGVDYTSSLFRINNIVELPVSFVYKLPINNDQRNLGYRAAKGAANAISRGSNFQNVAANAAMALFCDFDILAGLSPGYIINKSSGSRVSTYGQYKETTSIERRYGPSLTSFLGFSASLVISRISIKFSPTIHYNLTQNYVYKSVVHDLVSHDEKITQKTLGWYMNFTFAISYNF